jgi:hypothetical protein
MPLGQFDPPGFLDDLEQAQRRAWSDFLSEAFDDAARGRPEELEFDGPRAQFYNPLKVEADADAQTLDITWTAFPRNVRLGSVSDTQRWRRADSSRDLQDEYCEWSVERDPDTDKITRISFTCEGPEYWVFLANTAPDTALSVYRQFVGPEVRREDIFLPNGRYNPRNRFNATTVNGAMHLIQPSNTLTAEIELAAGSSVVREIGGRLLTDEQELIRCGQYGDPDRHSDPHIGALVNSLSRQKADVTLENPVGLYFAGVSTAGWAGPNGADLSGIWRYVRGTPEKPVRAVLEVPPGRDFMVGDITIDGRPIAFGAQVADFISMKLTGVATRFGRSTVPPMTACRGPRPMARPEGLEAAAKAAAAPQVRDFLDAPSFAARRQ